MDVTDRARDVDVRDVDVRDVDVRDVDVRDVDVRDVDVVDSHVHLLPERLGVAIRAFFAELGVDQQRFVYALDHETLCTRLAADGVSTAWTLPYVRLPGAATRLNEATAAIARACSSSGPIRVVAGCSVHPGDTDPADVVRRAVEDLGARVLKLHCSVGDFEPDDPRLDPVWSWVSQIRLPVVIHAGHSATGYTERSDLSPLGTVAGRWPEARIIVAHCGHHAVQRTVELMAAHPSLHADLTPVVFELVDLQQAAAQRLADRLLFGSDAPNTSFTVGEALAGLDRLGLSAEQRRAVTGGNARRLLAEVTT